MATTCEEQTGVVDGVAWYQGVPVCELDPGRFPVEWKAFTAEFGFPPFDAEPDLWPPTKRRASNALDQRDAFGTYRFGGFLMAAVIAAGPSSRLWQRFEATHGKSPDRAGPGFVARIYPPGSQFLNEPQGQPREALRAVAARKYADRLDREAEVRAAVMAEFRPQIEAEVVRRLEER